MIKKIVYMSLIPICLFYSCKQDYIVKKYYQKNKSLSDTIYYLSNKIKQEYGINMIIRQIGILDKLIEVDIQLDTAENIFYGLNIDNKNFRICNITDSLKKNQILEITCSEAFKNLLKLIRESRYEGIYTWKDGVFLSYGHSLKDISGNSRIGIAYYFNPNLVEENKFNIKIEKGIYVGHFAY